MSPLSVCFCYISLFPFVFSEQCHICYSASAIFVGVYEPAKRKLLELLPENLSAIAHLVSQLKKYLS